MQLWPDLSGEPGCLIKVWRINPHLLHRNLLVKPCNTIEKMASDQDELVVKTDRDIILFNLETGNQIWKLRWSLQGAFNQKITSNKIKQKIQIWKIDDFWRADRGMYTRRYSQFQLIRLIFEHENMF